MSHQLVTAASRDDDAVDLLAVYKQPPQTYMQLRLLYKVLLILPVTTASDGRGFFTARRIYASAVLGVVVLSVCPSVTRVICD